MSAIYAMLYVYVPTRQKEIVHKLIAKLKRENERKTGTGNSKTK